MYGCEGAGSARCQLNTNKVVCLKSSRIEVRYVSVAMLIVLLVNAGCMAPGAIAPSTIPVGQNYVELSPREHVSSCGYTVLTIPIKNLTPLSTLIEDMVRSRGGDALIEVSSHSSVTFYLVGVANCIEVRGKIVKITR